MSRLHQRLGPVVKSDLVDAYLALQSKFEDQGAIPSHSGTVISRHRRLWEILGAIHLGLLVAVLTIVINFILLNFLLHLPST